MRKTSYGWRQLLLANISQTKSKKKNKSALSSQQISLLVNKGMPTLAVVSLWWWNWQLLLATSVGVGLMYLSYKMSSRSWRNLEQKIVAFLTGYNRKLFIAVASGGIGGFFTYLATAIWLETDNHWLATGSILQGLATVAILISGGWYLIRHRKDSQHDRFTRLLSDLTAEDSLKRFVAIRQLTDLVIQKSVDREYRLQLIEYFSFMMLQPQDSAIQSALIDSLAILGVSRFNSPELSNMVKPLNIKHSVSENVL